MRMIANVDDLLRRGVEALGEMPVNLRIGLGGLHLRCAHRVLEQVPEADMLDARVAIADRAEAEALLQPPQARQHIVKKLDLLSGLEKHVESLLRHLFSVIIVQLADMMQKIVAHCGHVHRITPIARAELAPQIDHLDGVVVLGYARVVLLQPLVERFLGTVDSRHAGPERIIQVKGNYGNLIEHGCRFQVLQGRILKLLSRPGNTLQAFIGNRHQPACIIL